jgi:hypothetical protein
MKLKQFIASVGIAAATLTASAPAFAASFSAATLKSDDGFSFDKKTTVNFDFISSRGGNRSRFGIFAKNGNTLTAVDWLFTESKRRDSGNNTPNNIANQDDSLGTCSETAPNLAVPAPCSKKFTFQAGVTYLLGLEDLGILTGTPINGTRVYSNDPVGPIGNNARGMAFVQGPGNPIIYTNFVPNGQDLSLRTTTTLPLTARQVGIFVNDSWNGDLDQNDFVLRAEAVPEPATLLGLGAVAGGMVLARRRKAMAQ